ncbi:MAG: phosphoribosylformylglycinamidine synthase subunit PurQ [Phycisphaerales bacterium]
MPTAPPAPAALVITAPGINCDGELVEAFRLAGAEVESILLKRLVAEPALLARFELIGLPGGFSYGDDVAAGRIMAQLIRRSIYPALVAAIERGVPLIAPCNGFQIAVQAGLLPGPDAGVPWPAQAATPTIALMDNASARFSDRWVRVEIPEEARCIWTRGLRSSGSTRMLPIAHGEGRFVCDDALRHELERRGQVAIRYAADDNPNGSVADIAGICDASGLVFGLMPHPERYTQWTQHPFWTRLPDDETAGEPIGLAMFRNAVRHAVASRTATASAR